MDYCASSVFRSERRENYTAIYNRLNAEISVWEDAANTGVKIDDIVHTWDEKFDSQSTKCSEAQDAVDRFQDEYDRYSRWTYLGMPVYDEEEMVHACVNGWGHLGVYTIDEFDTSDWCVPFSQE